MNQRAVIVAALAAVLIGGAGYWFARRESASAPTPLVRAAGEPRAAARPTSAPPAVPATPKPVPPAWPALTALDVVLHEAYEEAHGHSSAALRAEIPKLDAAAKVVIADTAPALPGADQGWAKRRQQDLETRGKFMSDIAALSDEQLFLKFEDVVVVVEIMMSAADQNHKPVSGGHSHSKPTTPEEIAAAAAHAAECPLE